MLLCLRTFLGERPTTLTRSEKICFISEILSRNRFGSKPEEYGINTLKSEGILVAEYPMHEGPYQWTDHGLLNDRQVPHSISLNMFCMCIILVIV